MTMKLRFLGACAKVGSFLRAQEMGMNSAVCRRRNDPRSVLQGCCRVMTTRLILVAELLFG